MYQAIEVKFLPVTNHRGARYKARCQARSVTVTKEYGLKDLDEANRAFTTLVNLMGWGGTWHAGQLYNGNFVYVLSSDLKGSTLEIIS